MLKQDNLFGRQDELSEKFDEMSKTLGLLNDRVTKLENKTTQNIQKPAPTMKDFAKAAKKSWKWFGNEKEFIGLKIGSIASLLAVIILGIISTVLTALSTKSYSVFSIGENIWLIFVVVYLIVTAISPTIMNVNFHHRLCPLRTKLDEVGMSFTQGGEMIFLRIFRWLTVLDTFVNIIWIWINFSGISWLATIFELLFIVSIFVSFFVNGSFHSQYSICYLEGKSFKTGKDTTILKFPGAKNFILEKDAREMFPELFK